MASTKVSEKLALFTERGASSYLERELDLKGIGGARHAFETGVIVEECTPETMIRAAYTMQTPHRICMLLSELTIDVAFEETLLAFETLIGSMELKQYVHKDKSFFVKVHREGSHDFTSVDIAQEIGKFVKAQVKEDLGFVLDTDPKNPDMILYVHIDDDKAYMGIDLLGIDAAKRSYKVFNNPHSIKGPVAISLVLAAGWDTDKTLFDPFTSGGVLAVETALFATGRSLHYYEKKLLCAKHPIFSELVKGVLETVDNEILAEIAPIYAYDAQLRNINAAKKNAKIAGVDKNIQFSRTELEWVETKHEEKSIDCIATLPVEASKHFAEAKAEKLQKELFEQAAYVLTKNGRIALLCEKPDALIANAQGYGFVVESQTQVYTGKLPQWILVLKRK